MKWKKIRLLDLEISDETLDMCQIQKALASLYNDILNPMDNMFLMKQNRKCVKQVKNYIEDLYRSYHQKMKDEGLTGAKVYIQNAETKRLRTICLDDSKEMMDFITHYPKAADAVKQRYHHILSYPKLKHQNTTSYKIPTSYGKVSIPKEIRKQFGDIRTGNLLFYIPANELKNQRIQLLDQLVIQILSLDDVMKTLPLDFGITGLIELIDLEKSYIKKYALSHSGVMYIEKDGAVFELYDSELQLSKPPFNGYVRMVDRDKNLFSSIQNDSLKNKTMFQGSEQVLKDMKEVKTLVKEKKINPNSNIYK